VGIEQKIKFHSYGLPIVKKIFIIETNIVEEVFNNEN